jgi:hypothetical protein
MFSFNKAIKNIFLDLWASSWWKNERNWVFIPFYKNKSYLIDILLSEILLRNIYGLQTRQTLLASEEFMIESDLSGFLGMFMFFY